MPAGTEGHSERTGLRGLLVDLITPLRPDGTLDRYGLDSLLTQVPTERFDGVVSAGTTGEGPLLPLAVRAEITQLLAGQVPGFRHVLPMVLGTSPSAVLYELDSLASTGATGALVSPLSFYGTDAGAVTGFFGEVVDRSPLPIVLYNAPQLTGVQIPLWLVADLAAHDAVIGINDASGDTSFLMSLVLHVQDTPSFGVLCGDDAGLMAAVVVGASGAVTAGANLVPSLVCEVYGHSVTRSLHSARTAQRRLLSVVETCRKYGLPGAWKAAASEAGLCGPTPALAGGGLSPDDVRQLRAELAELGVLAASR